MLHTPNHFFIRHNSLVKCNFLYLPEYKYVTNKRRTGWATTVFKSYSLVVSRLTEIAKIHVVLGLINMYRPLNLQIYVGNI